MDQPPGVRPIAVGEALIKVSAIVAIDSGMERIREDFDGIQFGVGTRGGTDIVVHNVRKGYEEGKITVALDATNAFNTPYRSSIRKVLISSPDKYGHLYALWNVAYSRPSNLHYRTETSQGVILSQRGTRQGDPLAALLFALVLTPILQEAKRIHPTLDIYAYLDDITIQGHDPRTVARCVTFIRDEMDKIGMSLNENKCEWLHDTHPCPFPSWDSSKVYIKILGAYIGPDEVVRAVLLEGVQKKHAVLCERLREMNSGVAVILMRGAAIPQMNYLCRVHPPSVTGPACSAFDLFIEGAWSDFAQVRPDDISRALATLPSRLGGCGFTATTLIAKVAYEASTDFVFLPTAPSQAARCNVIMAKLNDSLCQNRDLALHLEDCKQKGSSTFLVRVLGGVPLPRDVTGAILRLRLCSCHRLCPDEPLCPGCQKALQRFDLNQHLRGCARIPGRNCAACHAWIKIGFHNILRKRGLFTSSKEPESLAVRRCGCGKSIPDNTASLEDHKAVCPQGAEKLDSAVSRRPDLEFYAGKLGIWVVIDVSLVAVIGHSAVQEANAQLDRLLGTRNNIKQDLYKLLVESRNAAFLVASATANGTLSNEMRMICSIIADNSNLYNDSYQKVCDEVISVVQEASGQALLNAERRMLYLPAKSHNAVLPAPSSSQQPLCIPTFAELANAAVEQCSPAPRLSQQADLPPACQSCRNAAAESAYDNWCRPCAERKGLVCHACSHFSPDTSSCPQCDRRFCANCTDQTAQVCHGCALSRDDDARRSCSLDSITRGLIYPPEVGHSRESTIACPPKVGAPASAALLLPVEPAEASRGNPSPPRALAQLPCKTACRSSATPCVNPPSRQRARPDPPPAVSPVEAVSVVPADRPFAKPGLTFASATQEVTLTPTPTSPLALTPLEVTFVVPTDRPAADPILTSACSTQEVTRAPPPAPCAFPCGPLPGEDRPIAATVLATPTPTVAETVPCPLSECSSRTSTGQRVKQALIAPVSVFRYIGSAISGLLPRSTTVAEADCPPEPLPDATSSPPTPGRPSSLPPQRPKPDPLACMQIQAAPLLTPPVPEESMPTVPLPSARAEVREPPPRVQHSLPYRTAHSSPAPLGRKATCTSKLPVHERASTRTTQLPYHSYEHPRRAPSEANQRSFLNFGEEAPQPPRGPLLPLRSGEPVEKRLFNAENRPPAYEPPMLSEKARQATCYPQQRSTHAPVALSDREVNPQPIYPQVPAPRQAVTQMPSEFLLSQPCPATLSSPYFDPEPLQTSEPASHMHSPPRPHWHNPYTDNLPTSGISRPEDLEPCHWQLGTTTLSAPRSGRLRATDPLRSAR